MSRVCLGVVAGAHGVRGLVRIKSFTEAPENLVAYGPLSDEAGTRRFEVTLKGQVKGAFLAAIAGIEDRNAAEALKGTGLYVERADLPAPEDEAYYHADLIGLAVEDRAGRKLGRVAALQNHGAGDFLQVEGPEGAEWLLPFTKAVVPVVDPAGGRLVVELPEEAAEEAHGKAG